MVSGTSVAAVAQVVSISPTTSILGIGPPQTWYPPATQPYPQSDPDPEQDKYVATSDVLEDFIRACGELDMTREEMLQLPMEHFVKWMIQEAAARDQRAPPEAFRLEDVRAKVQETRDLTCHDSVKDHMSHTSSISQEDAGFTQSIMYSPATLMLEDLSM